ncbi:MAG: imidazole glycerol phosphate synthase subunit HisF [Bacteroidota bacterium]
MLTKRIIPCLDIKDGRTVKGVQFQSLIDAGDPVEQAAWYSEQGADELVFLDITATLEKRATLARLASEIAGQIHIPFTIGGGIRSLADAEAMLLAGADKISINSAALKRPALIEELANTFGSQFVVVAIDAKQVDNQWQVFSSGGSRPTERELFSWAKTCQELGAGEILFTSMDHDGTKQGYANQALAQLSRSLHIPIIASGGAGTIEHVAKAFTEGHADAALAASIFHFREIEIPYLKKFLSDKGLPIRWPV